MKTFKKTALLALIFSIGLCVGCAGKSTITNDLTKEETKILGCFTEWIDCLNRTKAFKRDFDKFEVEIHKCGDEAKLCTIL